MSKKGLTKKGKARKVRIYEKQMLKKEKTQLITHIYDSILPMFKSFLLIFEQTHRKYTEYIRNFLN